MPAGLHGSSNELLTLTNELLTLIELEVNLDLKRDSKQSNS